MRTFNLSTLAALTAMFFTACGDDVTKVTQEASGLEVVASADSLGKCTAERSGEMKFVSKENAVFVCADSSWKNVSAAKKASCAAELLADSLGFKIVCDGDSVGVIFNGTDGVDGENGEAGASGKFCTIEESPLLDSDFGSGTYQVVCGGEIVGTIRDGFAGEGCVITDNGDGTVTQDCDGESVTLYKAFCGGKAYDPDSSVCHNERLYGFFEDARDGQVYRTVQIGTQTWMAENLNYAYMPDTLSFCYGKDTANCEKYGRLYTWSAAMDSAARFTENGKGCGSKGMCFASGQVRGVCPVGWHLPDTTELRILIDFVEKQTGNIDSVPYALMSESSWLNKNGSDVFGFGVLPAGYFDYEEAFHRTNFHDVNIRTFFVTSLKYVDAYKLIWSLEFSNRSGFSFSMGCCRGVTVFGNGYGGSIRCIKDY